MLEKETNPFAFLDEEEKATDVTEAVEQDSIDNETNPFSFLDKEDDTPTITETVEDTTKTETNPFAFLDEEEKATEDFQLDSDYITDTFDADKVKTLDEFAKDDRFLGTLRSYAKKRFGETGKQEEGESDRDYVKRFITHYRQINTNTLDLMGQVDWIRGASDADKEEFGALYRDIERLPDFYEEGGTSGYDAFVDYGLSILTDPATLIGFGSAKFATMGAQALARKSLLDVGKKATLAQTAKLGLQAAKKPLIVEGISEGLLGSYDTYALGEVEETARLRDEGASVGEIIGGGALSVGIVGGIGAIGYKSLGKEGIARARKELITQGKNDKAAAKLLSGNANVSDNVGRQITTNLDDTSFDPVEGRMILDNIDPNLDVSNLDALTKSVKVDLIKRVGKVATEVVEDMLLDPKGRFDDFLKAYQNGEKTASNAIGEILNRLEEFKDMDADILDGAIARAGISQEQFAKITFTSFSEAGKLLQAASPIGKLLKGYKNADPNIKKIYDEMASQTGNEPVGRFTELMQWADRERRALMVTQLSTTVRNVATGVTRLGFETGYNLLESSIYHAGRAANSLMTGEAAADIAEGRFSAGIRDIARDGFGQVAFMLDNNQSGELTDALLKYNPQLLRVLNRTTGEVGGLQNLSWVTSKLNTLNMAQDAFFRRGVFVSSIDKKLRRMGTSLAEVHRNQSVLPTKLLGDSVEDALSFTFSRMPKPDGKYVGDGLAHAFVTFNEKMGPLPSLIGAPVGTGAFPFARFMTNALQFQFNYSPVSFVGATLNSVGGVGKYLKGDVKAGEIAMSKAREQFSKGLIGYAALMTAINHREKNQDVRWYEAQQADGRTADLRPFFPLAPYLIVADLIVKWDKNELDKIDMKTVFEGLTGAQFRTGASSYMIENFFKTFRDPNGLTDITGEKIAEYMGGYLGEMVGGALTPGRVVRDVVAAFDEEEAIIRDTRRTEGSGAVERGLNSASNAVLRNLPFVSQNFPELESATRSGQVIRQSPIGSQLTGVRLEQRRTGIEKELIKYGFENYKVVPSTGDKTADAYLKKYMGELVETDMADLVETDSYKEATEKEKKIMLSNNLSMYKSLAKRIAEVEADTDAYEKGKASTPFDRAGFLRLSSDKRALVNEYYMSQYGKTVMEMQEAEPDFNHLRLAKRLSSALASRLR
jgi:hypothetical protein